MPNNPNDAYDLLSSIFGNGQPKPPPRPGDDVREQMSNRERCAKYGHRYQVHGKSTPSKVSCARCQVSWAIGPRTEPS